MNGRRRPRRGSWDAAAHQEPAWHGSEAAAALERAEPAQQPEAAGPRASRAPRRQRAAHGGATKPPPSAPGRPARPSARARARSSRTARCTPRAASTSRGGPGDRLDLQQSAPLVERAPELLERPVVMGMDDGGIGPVDLGVAGGQHVACQQAVLRVAHRAKRHPLPRLAGQAAVRVGEEEARASVASLAGPRSGSVAAMRTTRRARAAPSGSPRDVLGRARTRDRPCRPRSKPPSRDASQRSSAGTASWVRKATCAAGSLLRSAGCALLRERTGLEARRSRRRRAEGELARAVGRARVGHEQLNRPIDTLRAHGREDVVEKRAAVAYWDGHGHGVSHPGAASSDSMSLRGGAVRRHHTEL